MSKGNMAGKRKTGGSTVVTGSRGNATGKPASGRRSGNGLGGDPRREIVERIMTWVLGIAVAFIPLIVFLRSLDLVGAQLTSWRGQLEHVDFFNWWKAAALIVVFLILLGLHIYRWTTCRNTLEMPRLFLPMLLFLVFALLSAIASSVPEIAFGGFPDRYEGLWVLLAYGVLAYTAFVVSAREKAYEGILTAILASSLVVAGIGLFQFLGMDLFQTEFGKRLMLPKAFEQFMDQLTFNFGKNIMYTTVYNPNYLGSYAALLLPVAWSWTYQRAEAARAGRGLPVDGNRQTVQGSVESVPVSGSGMSFVKRYSWIAGLLFSLSVFILWIGSMSRAGLLGGVAAMFLYVVLQGRTIVRNPIPSVLLVGGMVAMFLFMNAASGGLVSDEFYQTLPSRVQQAVGMTPVAEEQVTASTSAPAGLILPEGVPPIAPAVQTVTLKDNRFRFETAAETMQMVLDKDAEGTLHFYDGSDSVLALAANGYAFTDARYAAYRVTRQEKEVILSWYQYSFYFSTENGKLTYVPKPYTYWTEVKPAPHIGFEGHERFATNRGWIWSRTLPMLGKSLFVGYGPDTFATFFPQDDIAWKINLYGASNIVVDKPHNWYLQTAVNTGVVSLGLLLWLLAAFAVDALRMRFRRPVRSMAALFGGTISGDPMVTLADANGRSIASTAGDGPTAVFVGGTAASGRMRLLAGILCGVAGYAIAGFFNDSVVSVAPVFWTVFGIGAGLLRYASRVPEQQGKAAAGKGKTGADGAASGNPAGGGKGTKR